MAEHPTCQHNHRVEIDQTSREQIEPKFDDIDPSAGFKFDANGQLQNSPSNLTLAGATLFDWCADCNHILVKWDMGGSPFETAFYDEEVAESLLKKFGPSAGTCQHQHKIGIDVPTREVIEPNLKGLDISMGFRPIGASQLRERNQKIKVTDARMHFWCADCSHIIVTWDISGSPVDAAFYDKKSTATLLEKFAPTPT